MVTGLLTRRSANGVTETVAALRAEVEQHGGVVVAVIDHAAAAQAVGLTLPATQVIIFGNPRAGTSLMQAVPETAIDLPLRILVRADGQPGSLVSWQDPAYVRERFGLDDQHSAPLETPATLVAAVLERR